MRKRRYWEVYQRKLWPHRKSCCILFSCFIILTAIVVVVYLVTKPAPMKTYELELGTPAFLIYHNKCKIPNVKPWSSEFQKYYERKGPYNCSNKELLTSISYNGDEAFLYVIESAVPAYTTNGYKCCYQTIEREPGVNADLRIIYSSCLPFENRVGIKATEVVVKCHENSTDREVYANVHSIIFKSETVKQKIAALKNKEKPPNVMLFGIDSVSRLNFHRMLPLTKEYLDGVGWVEYVGYNKVGENTFPNLMALLTGKNLSQVGKECNPNITGMLDQCNFIWKNYSDNNYVTTYIEDAVAISTFTFANKGFQHPPVDLYYRPYLIAAEALGTQVIDDMHFCSGKVSSGERILQVINEFMEQISDQPKFGLFWSNTFNHDNVNTLARMDKIIAHFFETAQAYLNNTIVLFFSDHGMRLGAFRLSKTGLFEDKLPFAYFWFPLNFRDRFPNEYLALVNNSMKLTTPYDVYMTLQHLLVLYNYNSSKTSFCDATKNCRSLLEDVGDRSCEDINTPVHYCSCFAYTSHDIKSELAQQASVFAVGELNKIIQNNTYTRKMCQEYTLDKVMSAQTADYKNVSYLLFQLQTQPSANFEFMVSFDSNYKNKLFQLEREIIRVDRYKPTSRCVEQNKQYCYCKTNVSFPI